MAGGFWIRFGDTDPYGVVYYSTYHRYAHQAVEDFLRERGLDPDSFFRNTDEGYGMPVVASRGRFTSPVRYPAFIIPVVRVEKIGRTSVTFRIDFLNNNLKVAEVELVFVCIDREWRKRELPESLKKVLGG